jgi:ABC-type phosphate transport system auxiliary subunit
MSDTAALIATLVLLLAWFLGIRGLGYEWTAGVTHARADSERSMISPRIGTLRE